MANGRYYLKREQIPKKKKRNLTIILFSILFQIANFHFLFNQLSIYNRLETRFKSVTHTDFSFFIRLDDIDTRWCVHPFEKGFPRGKRKFL